MLEEEFEAKVECPICGKATMMYFKTNGHERDASADYQECLECHWCRWGWSDNWYPPEEGHVPRRIRRQMVHEVEKKPVGCFLAFVIIVLASMFTMWLINLL